MLINILARIYKHFDLETFFRVKIAVHLAGMACDTSLDLQDDIDENLIKEILNNSDIVKALGHTEVIENRICSLPKATPKKHSPPQDFSITQALERENSDKKKFVYPHQININLKLVSNCLENQETESNEANTVKVKPVPHCYINQKSSEKCENHVGPSKDITDIDLSCNSNPISQPTSPILSSRRNRKKRKHTTSSCGAGDDVSVKHISTLTVGCHKNTNSLKPVQIVSNKVNLPSRCPFNANSIPHSDAKTNLTPLCTSTSSFLENATPTKTKTQQRHFQSKTSFTPSGTEYNPWKKQESLSKRRRTFSGSCVNAQTGNLLKLKPTPVVLKNTAEVMQTNFTPGATKQTETVSFLGGKSCQGFKTASNKDVKISSEAWNKAKDLMKCLDEPPNALSQRVPNTSPIKVSIAAWLKIESQTPCNMNATASKGNNGTTVKNLKMALCQGFKTANNKDLKISNNAWTKAIQFMNNVEGPSNEHPQKVVTRSPITISKASSSKAESTLQCKDQMLTNTKHCNIQTKKQPIVQNTSCGFPEISNNCGFSTASKKAITVSKQAWTKAMQFMENESSALSQNCGNLEGNLNHISSGGCKPITIPKEAWNKAKHVMSSSSCMENKMEKTDNITGKSVAKNVEKICKLERKVIQPVGTLKSVKPNSFTTPKSLQNLPENSSDSGCGIRTPSSTVRTTDDSNLLNQKAVLRSFPSAKRRNSAYKPPRSKRDKLQNHSKKTGPDIAQTVDSEKENVVPSSQKSPACRSIGKRLGIKTNPETQIMMSDESLLLALELIENT